MRVPACPRRIPPAELHRRIAEIRHQVEPLGVHSEVHPVGMAVGPAGVVVEPDRPGVRPLAGAKDRHDATAACLRWAGGRSAPRVAMTSPTALLERRRVLGIQIERQPIDTVAVGMLERLDVGRHHRCSDSSCHSRL